MHLTHEERKTLEEYQKRRDWPPTMGNMIAAGFPHYVKMLVVFSTLAWIAIANGIPVAAGIVIGMAVGAISRDIANYQRIARMWPTLSGIIDWTALDKQLAENSNE